MQKRLASLSLASSLVIFAALSSTACDGLLPTNPYDPAAPALEQAKGQVEGTILLDDPAALNTVIGDELDAISVTITTLSGDDLATYGCADSANFVCDAGTRSGHFIFRDLAAGDYIVNIAGVNPRYVPISLPRLTLAPGERYDFGTLRYVVLSVEGGTGVVEGLAGLNAGNGAGRTMKLLRKTGQGLQAFMTVLSDDNGHFRFANLPPGTYGLSAELADYTPDYRAGFEIPSEPVDGASFTIVHFADDPESVPADQHTASNTALRLNRVTAVLIPAIQQTFGKYYTNQDEVPIQVLQFGGMNQMRLSANENFCLDSVEDGGVVEDAGDCQNKVPWQQYSASAVVSLPDVEGEIPIYAQFKNTQVPGFTFVSSVYETQVVRDVTSPSIESVTVRGRVAADDGKIWFGSEAPLLSLDIDASDANSGVYSVALYHAADNAVPVDPSSLSFVLNESPAGLVRLNVEQGLTAGEGQKTVYAYLKDRAGNISAAGQVEVWVDATAPVVESLILNNGVSVSAYHNVVVNISASDSLSHVVGMKIWEEGQSEPDSFVNFANGASISLRPLDYDHVLRQVNAVVVDQAGNVSAQASAPIAVDDRGSLSGILYIDPKDNQAGSVSGLACLLNGQSCLDELTTRPRTQDDGFDFSIAHIPQASNLRLRFEKTGYASSQTQSLYAVVAGQETVLTETLHLSLAQGSIAGYVHLAGESDHSGTVVAIEGGSQTTFTEQSGYFRLDGVVAESGYTLNFSHGSDWSQETLSGVDVNADTVTMVRDEEHALTLTPLQGDFYIAEGAYTAATDVTLHLQYDGASQYCANEDPAQLDASCHEMASNPGDYPSVLTGADGSHTIYVKFILGANGESTVRHDSIILDREDPVVSSAYLGDGQGFTASNTVSLTATATDTSPITHYRLSQFDTTDAASIPVDQWSASSLWTGQTISVILDDTQDFYTARVWLQVEDAAGNRSAAKLSEIVKDSKAPTAGSIVINAGESISNDFNVMLTLTATDDTAIEMLLGDDTTALASQWQTLPAAGSKAWILPPSPQGEKQVCVKFRDAAHNETDEFCDDIDYDSIAPSAPEMTASEGAYSNSTELHLHFANVTSGGVQHIELATNAAFSNASSYGAVTDLVFQLPDPDGNKVVYARYIDAAGNVSDVAALDIVLDRQAPESADFNFVDGDYTTHASGVSLVMQAVGAIEMKISADDSCASGSWEAYATSSSVDLADAGSDGEKNVSVVYRDRAGNESACLTKTITLDTQGPVLGSNPIVAGTPSLELNASGDAVERVLVRLDFNVSGASQMKISNQSGLADAIWQDFNPSVSAWSLQPATDGTRKVYVNFRDAAGNETGEIESPDIEVDTHGTISGSLTVEAASDYTGLSFYLDGNAVTPTFSGSTFTISSVLAASYSFLTIDKDGYDRVTVRNVQVPPGGSTDLGPLQLKQSRGAVEGYVVLGDDKSPAGIALELVNTGYTATANSLGYFIIKDVLVGTYDLNAHKEGYADRQSTSINVTTGVTVQVSDAASPISLPVLSGDFTINGGASYTSATQVHLNLDFTASSYCASEDQNAIDSGAGDCTSYSGTGDYPFDLSDSDGTHTVYVKFSNSGSPSNVLQSGIILDRRPPEDGTLVIEDGAAAINALNVSLALSSTDVVSGIATSGLTQVAFSEDGSTYSTPATYQTPYTYTFAAHSSGDSLCLSVRYIDAAGNWSSGTAAHDCIEYDTEAPTGEVFITNPTGTDITSSQTEAVYLWVTTTHAHVEQMKISNTPSLSDVSWQPFSSSLQPWTLAGGDGTRTVYVALKDWAGNVSTAMISDDVDVDKTAPAAPDFSVDAGAFTSNTTVHLSLNGDLSDVAKVWFSDNRDPGNSQEKSVGANLSFTLTSDEGLHLISLRYEDGAGNMSEVTTASLVFDTTAPTGRILIDDGAEYSTDSNAQVSLSLTAQDIDSGVIYMYFSNDINAMGNRQNYASTYGPWTLSSGIGDKAVYAWFEDRAGNISAPVSDNIYFDNVGPTAPSLLINSGASETTNAQVVLSLGASGATWVKISSGGACVDGDWQSYSDGMSASWTFDSEGDKQLSAIFRDDAGNLSSCVYDSITYDATTPESPSVLIDNAAAYSNNASGELTLRLNAVNATQVRIGESYDFSTGTATSWDSYNPASPDLSYTLADQNDGIKVIYAQFKDAAGNTTPVVYDSIIFDVTKPDQLYLRIDNGQEYTRDSAGLVDLYISASDPVSGLMTLEVGNATSTDCNTVTTWTSYDYVSLVPDHVLDSPTSVNGEDRFVCMRVTDRAGNQSSTQGAQIILDNVVPSGSMHINEVADQYTNTRSVVLSFSPDSGSGVTGVAIRNDSSPDCSTASYGAFLDSQPWTLTSGDGVKTVYVCLRDAAGNYSSVLSDGITLDTEAPETDDIKLSDFTADSDGLVSVSVTLLHSEVTSPPVTVSLNPLNGASASSFSITAGHTNGNGSVKMAPAADNIEDGTYLLEIRLSDAAGNSRSYNRAVVVDRGQPIINGSEIPAAMSCGENLFVSSSLVHMWVWAFDESTEIQRVEVDNGSGTVTTGASGADIQFNLSTSVGTVPQQISIKAYDMAGNVSDVYHRSLVYDPSSPSISSVTINDGAANTADPDVRVSLSVTDGSLTNYPECFQMSIDGGPWQSFSSNFSTFLVNDGEEGTNTVSVQVRDPAKNTGSASASIVLDWTAPHADPLTINSGLSPFTTSTTVHVEMTVDQKDSTGNYDVTGFYLSDLDSSCPDDATSYTSADFSSGSAATQTVLHGVDGSEGGSNIILMACLRDATGNRGESFANIILDTSAPIGELVLNDGDAATGSTSVTYSIDGASFDAEMMRICNQGGTAGLCEDDGLSPCSPSSSFWIPFAADGGQILSNGDGDKRLLLCLRDAAGNYSEVLYDDIVLDTTPPSTPSALVVMKNGTPHGTGPVYVNTATVNLAWQGNASAEAVDHYEVTVDGESYVSDVPFVTTNSLVDGTYSWTVVAVDAVGNVSTVAASGPAFVVDTEAPSAPQYRALSYESTSVSFTTLHVDVAGSDSPAENFRYYMVRSPADPVWHACSELVSGTGRHNSNLVEGINMLRIVSVDRAGNVSTEETLTLRNDQTPPDPVQNLVIDNRDGEVQISWEPSPSSDVAFYRVFYGSQPSDDLADFKGNFAREGQSPINVGRNLSIVLSGLENGTTFRVAVVAYDKTENPGPNQSGYDIYNAKPTEFPLHGTGGFDLLGMHEIKIHHGYAYVSNSDSGLKVYRVHDLLNATTEPAWRIIVKKQDGSNELRTRIEIFGNMLYVYDRRVPGLGRYNISDPAAPQALPDSDSGRCFHQLYSGHRIPGSGTFAYAVYRNDENHCKGQQLFLERYSQADPKDLTADAQPSLIMTESSSGDQMATVRDAQLIGANLYMLLSAVDDTDDWMRAVVDTANTDPKQQYEVQVFDVADASQTPARVNEMCYDSVAGGGDSFTASEHYQYASVGFEGLSIKDTAPGIAPNIYEITDFPGALTWLGNYLVAGMRSGEDEMRVYDIDDRELPREVGSLPFDAAAHFAGNWSGRNTSLAVDGKYVFMVANSAPMEGGTPDDAYLRVAKLGQNRALDKVQSLAGYAFHSTEMARSMIFGLIGEADQSTLQVYDIRTPETPVSSFDLGPFGAIRGVSRMTDDGRTLVYAIETTNDPVAPKVQIGLFDVSAVLTSVQNLGSWNNGGAPWHHISDMQVYGNGVFVSTNAGVFSFGINDPASIDNLQAYPSDASTIDATEFGLVGNSLYVGDNTNVPAQVIQLDVSPLGDIAGPVQQRVLSTTAVLSSVRARGEKLYFMRTDITENNFVIMPRIDFNSAVPDGMDSTGTALDYMRVYPDMIVGSNADEIFIEDTTHFDSPSFANYLSTDSATRAFVYGPYMLSNGPLINIFRMK